MKVVGPDLLAKGLRRAQPIRLGQQEKLVRHLLPAGDGCPERLTLGRPGQSSPAQPPVSLDAKRVRGCQAPRLEAASLGEFARWRPVQ